MEFQQQKTSDQQQPDSKHLAQSWDLPAPRPSHAAHRLVLRACGGSLSTGCTGWFSM